MSRTALIALMLAGSTSIPACGRSEHAAATASNFVAEVSGSITGQVSGPGLIRFIPPSDTGFGPRPGYFFVADDSGVRDLGITFTIPANTQPGTYQLVSAHPMDSGKFEVRVDRSVGNRTQSFQLNTQGMITLEAFPNDGIKVTGSRVIGNFDFSTQDPNGREITAKGTFDFIGG